MPRPPAASRSKPATVTRAFLFADLREYTSFVEAKGDAAAARLLREYRTLVRREVGRHAGAEVKTEGDSFYVVFDRASSALDCAVAILRAADARNARDPDSPLRIGIGLHAGETVEYDDQFVGSAVNIASRLAGKAAAMELVISDTLRGLVRTTQMRDMRDIGGLELKGVAEPIRAWSVEWRDHVAADGQVPVVTPAPAPQPAPASGQLLCPVVVGRTAEISRFDDALDAAVTGAGQTVVLGGEAGVGKTRFVREAQARAGERGLRVLVGATHESDGTLPYAPFVSAVRSGFRGLARDELGRVLQRSAPDLAELFPELARAERAASPTTLERHRLSVAFQHLFRSFAREAPLLVVLEDVHWADETSLELLRHLARELRDARVVMLATYRTDEMHRRHPFLRTLADLQRERLVSEIQLKRLTRDETRELIRATMATRDPSVKVSDEFLDALHGRAEGNPFFTEELLKALVESGGVYLGDNGWARKPIADLAIPGSVLEAVRARVEQLGDDARATLAAAAVIGLRFSFDLLRDVRGLDDERLEMHLRQVIEEQLISEAGRDVDEYAFRHALTREVVYDDLMVRERKRLHRAVADVLEQDPHTEPAILAHHLLASGERERAVPVLLRAGDRAMQTGAPREAAAHYASVVEIGRPDGELASVVERQAEAYHLFDQALAAMAAREAGTLFEDLGDTRGHSRMLRIEGRALFYQGKEDEAEERTREAIAVLSGEDSVEHARALAQLAGLTMTRYDMTAALPLAEQAVALAERVGDDWAVANALITRGSVYAGDRGLPDLRRGLDIARRAGIHEAAQRAYNNIQLVMIGQATPWQERLHLIDEGIEYGRAHGFERGTTAFLVNHRLYVEYGTGRWDAALATAHDLETSGNAQMAANGIRVRALITAARDGHRAALRVYADYADLRLVGPLSQLLRTIDLARGFAAAGEREGALRQLALLESLTAEMPVAGSLGTPASTAIGGPGGHALIIAAVVLDERKWLDAVVGALREETTMRQNDLRLVAAGQAVLDADAATAARGLLAARTVVERVGLLASWHDVAMTFHDALRARGISLGADWEPIVAELRSFATGVGATARLAELEDD